jgi:hypothetical protein
LKFACDQQKLKCYLIYAQLRNKEFILYVQVIDKVVIIWKAFSKACTAVIVSALTKITINISVACNKFDLPRSS